MKIVYSLEELALDFRPTVVTIGNFDGLHLGHQVLLEYLKKTAAQLHGCSVVLTFQQHPSEVLSPDNPVLRLMTPLHKIRILSECGIDVLALLPFTRKFSLQTAEEFLNNLYNLKPFSHLILGYDALIGKDRQGDRKTVVALAKKLNFHVEYLAPALIDGVPISSRQIRRHLQQGDLAEVQRLLGRHYSIYTEVIEGSSRENLKGFPTANLSVEGLCLPPFGEYAVKVLYEGNELAAVANHGFAPTMQNSLKQVLEVHLHNQTADLYGKMIEVVFY